MIWYDHSLAITHSCGNTGMRMLEHFARFTSVDVLLSLLSCLLKAAQVATLVRVVRDLNPKYARIYTVRSSSLASREALLY